MVILAVVAGLVTFLHYFLDVSLPFVTSTFRFPTLGQCAVAELEAARVVEVVRTDSVSVWSGMLLADTYGDRRATSWSVRQARAAHICVNKSVNIVEIITRRLVLYTV